MKVNLEILPEGSRERSAHVVISAEELDKVYLHIAYPEKRNRTDRYMRRHRITDDDESLLPVNKPIRSPEEPKKISIAHHIDLLRKEGAIPPIEEMSQRNGENFMSEPLMLAVPISDLVANLLRPSYHREMPGSNRVFFFEDEPIEQKRKYFCICSFDRTEKKQKISLKQLYFDAKNDCVRDSKGNDLHGKGLVWAAALVPLVVSGKALPAVEIAKNDYDLRQIVGRDAEEEMSYAYEGWFDQWEGRVEKLVKKWENEQHLFSIFYHSILAIDESGNIHIFQREGTLPSIACDLVKDGMVAAGLLDSGGSCSLYDVWMGGYLNHCKYYREPRGSILLFLLNNTQDIPMNTPGIWMERRKIFEQYMVDFTS
ncbi:hypothetical protein ACFL5S_00445 [Fibrobacterota bacterium]